MKPRRLPTSLGTVIAAMVLSASFVYAGGTAAPWNVLFFAIDDLRPELGAYGRPVKTPQIDAIASRGIVFERAYCQQAVCSPSRASLLTGARPDTTQVWDLKTHFRRALPHVITLPQHFKNHGYFVQALGKIFHGNSDDPQSWSVPWWRPDTENWGTPGSYGGAEAQAIARENAARIRQNPESGDRRSRGPAFEGADVPDDTFHDGLVASRAISILREMKAIGRPFWLGVGFIRPHLPFVAPKKYWDLYAEQDIQLATNPFPQQGAPSFAVPEGSELRGYAGIPDGHIPDALARQIIHGYWAAISYMDAQVGRVMGELERLGLLDRTVVVLWGDHGWKLGEHDAWAKHTNVEYDTRVPLIVSVPGLTARGTRSYALVELVDIFPSLAEFCGLPLPGHLEGVSFQPLLRNPQLPWKTAVFSQYPRVHDGRRLMGRSMRTEQYRLTRWVEMADSSKLAAVELYDLVADPQENTNVATEPGRAPLIERLTAQAELGWRGAVPAWPRAGER